MKSNYKRIGDHIREIKAKNSDLTVTELLGINIHKFFMPSVANVIGTDLTNYKVVNKGQFACNRMHVGRDYRIPIAVSRSSMPFIVSPAYDVFEIEDSRILDSDYLMMWFSRKEFDRNAWFFTDADVRGGLPWKSFCDLELPIPHIDKQREIVKEYNSIVNRIKFNEQLIQKLEETAQAIYKEWFVEFQFPDKNGKPYKSNGGEMQWNDLLGKEIPKDWAVSGLSKLITNTIGGDWGKDEIEGNYCTEVLCVRGTDILKFEIGITENTPVRYILFKNLNSRRIKPGDIVIEISGGSPTQSTGRNCLFIDKHFNNINKPIICSNFCRVMTPQIHFSEYLKTAIQNLLNNGILFQYENSSNGVKNLALDDVLNQELFAIPTDDLANKFSMRIHKIYDYKLTIGFEVEKLNELKNILLLSLSKTS